jgi:catechol 2,3-dioxygenase-like lactoylglutathione lyase family enzyme
MPINKLAHFSVRTPDLDASKRFYAEVLGFHEGFRPPFNFPGVWLYRGDDEADFGVVHLIGIDPNDPDGLKDYLGDKGEDLRGSGAVDHLAFLAADLLDMHVRLGRAGLAYRERTVPSLGLHQVFFEDPSGVTIELNFPAAEAKGLRSLGATNEQAGD